MPDATERRNTTYPFTPTCSRDGPPTALIYGITGQDGSYLADLLLHRGYEVHGVVRRASLINTARIDHIYEQLHLHYGDVTDASSVAHTLRRIKPDEIYNLAAQSHVKVSMDCPDYSFDVASLGCLRILEALRDADFGARFYQASSSEMFGSSPPPQSETTPFCPRSPYACGKLAAYWLVRHYREAYGLLAHNGILFNHESPRRGETFVTRKIAKAVARIALGQQNELRLGNLDAKRDWGFAPDYVRAMHEILTLYSRKDAPSTGNGDDYVIATGQMHTVREFCQKAFAYVDLDWRQYVVVDPRYMRASEVDALQGDASKASNTLGWQPHISFTELVEIMVDAEMARAGGKTEYGLSDIERYALGIGHKPYADTPTTTPSEQQPATATP